MEYFDTDQITALSVAVEDYYSRFTGEEIDARLAEVMPHVQNSTIHVTSAERAAWNGKQPTITDLATIRSNAANGATAYGWGNHASAGYMTLAGDEYVTGNKYFQGSVVLDGNTDRGISGLRNGVYFDLISHNDTQVYLNFLQRSTRQLALYGAPIYLWGNTYIGSPEGQDAILLSYDHARHALVLDGNLIVKRDVIILGMDDTEEPQKIAYFSELLDVVDAGLPSASTPYWGLKDDGTLGWIAGDGKGIESLAWSAITDHPTTLAGYGITDRVLLEGALNGYATETWVNQYFLGKNDTAENAEKLNGCSPEYFLTFDMRFNGNNKDWNLEPYKKGENLVLNAIHIPNMTDNTNIPFYGYGAMLSLGGATYFPFRLAFRQESEGEKASAYLESAGYFNTEADTYNYEGHTWREFAFLDSKVAGADNADYALKAGDTYKLGGILGINYARRDVDNTLQGLTTFDNVAVFNYNVGIGTANPVEKLHVRGNAYVTEKLGVGVQPTSDNSFVVKGRSYLNGAMFLGDGSDLGNIGLSYDHANNALRVHGNIIADGDIVFLGGIGAIEQPVVDTLTVANTLNFGGGLISSMEGFDTYIIASNSFELWAYGTAVAKGGNSTLIIPNNLVVGEGNTPIASIQLVSENDGNYLIVNGKRFRALN